MVGGWATTFRVDLARLAVEGKTRFEREVSRLSSPVAGGSALRPGTIGAGTACDVGVVGRIGRRRGWLGAMRERSLLAEARTFE